MYRNLCAFFFLVATFFSFSQKKDWFEKENWINVATGAPCGASGRTRKKRK